jgi:hypothetical protein
MTVAVLTLMVLLVAFGAEVGWLCRARPIARHTSAS